MDISESQPADFVIFNPAARVSGFDLTAAKQSVCQVKLVGVK
jgi:hypothetical protein